MTLFKSNKNRNNKGSDQKRRNKETKYVWLASSKAIFLIVGEPKESKYSYGVPIIPLFGYYKSDGKRYTAKELSDYYVVLNVPKDADIDDLKGKRLVIIGFDEDEVYIEKGVEDEKEEKKGDGK